MTTAFVLSGGASFGAVQVGMLQALADRRISPDLLVGTSSGALNAAFLASRGVTPSTVDALGNVWRTMRGRQLFRPSPRTLAALFGYGTSVCTDRGMRDLIEAHLEFLQLEDALIPLLLIATDMATGEEVSLEAGPAEEAILASSAIPGILPPVSWNGRTLVDGGLADNAGITPAVQAGADRIFVLPCGYPSTPSKPLHGALGALAHAMAVLVHHRLMRDIRLYADTVDLIVFPAPRTISVNPLDFGHSAELIDRAYEDAARFLDDDGRRDLAGDADLDTVSQGGPGGGRRSPGP